MLLTPWSAKCQFWHLSRQNRKKTRVGGGGDDFWVGAADVGYGVGTGVSATRCDLTLLLLRQSAGQYVESCACFSAGLVSTRGAFFFVAGRDDARRATTNYDSFQRSPGFGLCTTGVDVG